MPVCNVCHNHCNLKEGMTGLCHGRICRDGEIVCANYGHITSIALDPIEKKPLNNFHPGSNILSVGSYGCNLRCPFCQNHSISYGFTSANTSVQVPYQIATPEKLVEIALSYSDKAASPQQGFSANNIGIAFTYNEPLIGYEFVRDTAMLSHENSLLNVVVSNGNVSKDVCREILPYIDAMNIDLKGFTDSYYEDILKGSRKMVMDFIEEAFTDCHMELTTLIVPGYNDSEKEIESLAKWVSTLSPEIPLHISRFFPRFNLTDRDATDVDLIYHLADVARSYLHYVYTGNC